jgi:hypothetical protein
LPGIIPFLCANWQKAGPASDDWQVGFHNHNPAMVTSGELDRQMVALLNFIVALKKTNHPERWQFFLKYTHVSGQICVCGGF